MKIPKPESPTAAAFALQVRALKLPVPTREYRFLAARKFRLDFAWPELRFGVECDGAVHRLKKMFQSDREKDALALIAGWRILRVTRAQVTDGRAIGWTQEILTRLALDARGYLPLTNPSEG